VIGLFAGRVAACITALMLLHAMGRGAEAAGVDPLPLAASYGSGVHAYFAGDYDRSYQDLSAAIEGGTTDPRVWYFRGLAALRLGRIDEAEADFTTAAERESHGTGGWPVARSLERVQGVDRLRLERHRVRARVAALQRDQEAVRRRYSEIEDAEPDVLRRRRPLPKAPADAGPFEDRRTPAARSTEDAPAAETLPKPEPSEPASPEPDPEPKPEPKPEMTDEKPAAPPAEDPFSDGSAPKPAKTDDPFADGSAPKPDAPAAEAAPAAEPALPGDL
jgi:tetratricopeptide (TPR) repeat protein